MANSRNSGSENSRSPLFLRQVEECLIVFLTNYQRLIVSEGQHGQEQEGKEGEVQVVLMLELN